LTSVKVEGEIKGVQIGVVFWGQGTKVKHPQYAEGQLHEAL
jgi:hypothetical protein